MSSIRRKLALLLLAFAIGAAVSVRSCWARPTATVGAVVPATERIPIEQVNHSAWAALLSKHVDAQGMVNYAAWKASAADQKSLDEYLVHLSAASFGGAASREAQWAFWINSYNAVTVKRIRREQPARWMVDAFNPATVESLVCRMTLSVDWQGYLYDCDFNRMLELGLSPQVPRHIHDFDLEVL